MCLYRFVCVLPVHVFKPLWNVFTGRSMPKRTIETNMLDFFWLEEVREQIFKQISNNDYENKNYDTKLYEIFPNDFDTFKKYKMQIYNTIGYSGIVKINEDNYIIGKYYRFSIDNAFWRNKYSSQEEEKKLFIICNNLIKDAFFFWKLEAST